MARIYPTFIMFLLHVFLGFEIYKHVEPYTAKTKTETPGDVLKTKADYPIQSAFIALYEEGAEIAIRGKVYQLSCTPHQNTLGEWEAVSTATADFIKVGADGLTTARIGGKYMAFLPE